MAAAAAIVMLIMMIMVAGGAGIWYILQEPATKTTGPGDADDTGGSGDAGDAGDTGGSDGSDEIGGPEDTGPQPTDLGNGWSVLSDPNGMIFSHNGNAKLTINSGSGIVLPHSWDIGTGGEWFKIQKLDTAFKRRFYIHATNNDSRVDIYGRRTGQENAARYDGDKNLDYKHWAESI